MANYLFEYGTINHNGDMLTRYIMIPAENTLDATNLMAEWLIQNNIPSNSAFKLVTLLPEETEQLRGSYVTKQMVHEARNRATPNLTNKIKDLIAQDLSLSFSCEFTNNLVISVYRLNTYNIKQQYLPIEDHITEDRLVGCIDLLMKKFKASPEKDS